MCVIAKRHSLGKDNRYMKKIPTLIALLISASAVAAWGAGNALWQAEQSCIKYPTPDARTECEKRLKDGQVAFEKELKKKKNETKPSGDTQNDFSKKNDLCFKRESTGETVCPN